MIHKPDEPACRTLLAAATDPVEFHLEVFLKVCDAVQFAHARGVLHRDLKPDNVMLGSYGEVYVVDWGIAVALLEDTALPLARDATGIAGSPAYMAPEMAAARSHELTERTDVYLLGATLCEALTGAPPHRGASVAESLVHAYEGREPEFDAGVPDEVAAVLKRAMAPRPEDRYARVDELRQAVLSVRRHRGSHRLVREAEGILRGLLDPANAGATGAGDTGLQASFAECRFAFRQALAEWGENAAAKRGLRSLLEAQCAYELARGSPRSAQSLLAQLPEPRPELAERVRQAIAAANELVARAKKLDALQADADVNTGASARARVVLFCGVLWSATAFATGRLVRAGRLSIGYREAAAIIAIYAVSALGAFEVFRRNNVLNEAQRKLGLGYWWVTLAVVLHVVLAALAGVPIDAAISSLCFMVGALWILGAALFDWRLWASGASFVAGAFAQAIFPRARFELFGATIVLAFAFVWRAWGRPARPAPER